jgi:hypothetical protein
MNKKTQRRGQVVVVRQQQQPPKRQRPRGRGNGNARTPLLPAGVNNKETMPKGASSVRFCGSELVDIRSVNGTSVGETIYETLITPSMCRRLGLVAQAYQRIKWHKAKIRIVALNGSTTTAGYTAGVIEDPEIVVPATGKNKVALLTSCRASVVRQAWVEAEGGMMVPVKDMPEMFTHEGSDVRRYSPGRFVMVAGGNIENGTFQIHLDYDVTLGVPIATLSADPEEGTFETGTTDNSMAGGSFIRLPQTRGGDVTAGTTMTISGDIVFSLILTDQQSVGHIGIIRAGTRVTFSNSSGFWTLDWFGKPEGQTAYIVGIKTVGSASTMSVIANNGGSFNTWTNTSQA